MPGRFTMPWVSVWDVSNVSFETWSVGSQSAIQRGLARTSRGSVIRWLPAAA
jgi:hypothetical protein